MNRERDVVEDKVDDLVVPVEDVEDALLTLTDLGKREMGVENEGLFRCYMLTASKCIEIALRNSCL